MLDLKKMLTHMLQNIGKIEKFEGGEPDYTACATSKFMQLGFVTLDKGTWIISGVGVFPYVNTTGVRRVYVTTATSGYNNVTTGPAATANMLYNQVPITGSYQAFVHVGPFPINVTQTTTYRLIAWQNSGSTINVVGRMYAVKVT